MRSGFLKDCSGYSGKNDLKRGEGKKTQKELFRATSWLSEKVTMAWTNRLETSGQSQGPFGGGSTGPGGDGVGERKWSRTMRPFSFVCLA